MIENPYIVSIRGLFFQTSSLISELFREPIYVLEGVVSSSKLSPSFGEEIPLPTRITSVSSRSSKPPSAILAISMKKIGDGNVISPPSVSRLDLLKEGDPSLSQPTKPVAWFIFKLLDAPILLPLSGILRKKEFSLVTITAPVAIVRKVTVHENHPVRTSITMVTLDATSVEAVDGTLMTKIDTLENHEGRRSVADSSS